MKNKKPSKQKWIENFNLF